MGKVGMIRCFFTSSFALNKSVIILYYKAIIVNKQLSFLMIFRKEKENISIFDPFDYRIIVWILIIS